MYESLLFFLTSFFLPVLEPQGLVYVSPVLYHWTASLTQVNNLMSLKLSLPLSCYQLIQPVLFAFLSPCLPSSAITEANLIF